MTDPSKAAEIVEQISDIAIDEDRLTNDHTFERVLLHLGDLALDPGLDGEHYREVIETIGDAYADLAAHNRGMRNEDSAADTVYNLVHELAGHKQLAAAITGCEAFGALVTNLCKATGDRDRMREVLVDTFEGIDEGTKLWLVEDAAAPAAFVANRVQ